MFFEEGCGYIAEALCVKDGLFIVTIKLTHLVLFEVWDEIALVLSHDNLRKEIADT